MPPKEDNSHYEKILATGEVKCIDDEIPFEIPKSWEWCRIKNIFFTTSGGTPKKGHPEYYINGTIPWVKSGELCDKYLYSAENLITEEGLQNSSAKYFPIDTVAVAMYGATIGKTSIFKSTLTTNQAICGIFPNRYIIPEYLYYFIQAKTPDYLSIAFGSGQPNISQDKIKETLFPVPPMIEQERIVKSLDILIQQVTIYDETQIKLKQLNNDIYTKIRKSILQEAIQGRLVPQIDSDEPATVLLEKIKAEKLRLVKEGKLKKKDLTDSTIFKGDDNKYYEKCGSAVTCIESELPFEIPDSWRWCKIGDIFRHNNGKQLNKGNNKGVLMDYITTSNLYWNGFVLDSLKQMPYEETEIERCQAEKGDLLVCEGGDVGRSCIWMYDKPIMLQNHIHKLRAYIPICTKYFYYIFYLYNLMGIIGGKGIGIQGFSSKALHNTRVPLPPKEEQYRIVEKVEQALTSIMSR